MVRGESLEQVFWRLVKAGLSQIEIAHHPDYREAWAREVCHHCGSLPDRDGDHTCPCPYRDEECPDHRLTDRPE